MSQGAGTSVRLQDGHSVPLRESEAVPTDCAVLHGEGCVQRGKLHVLVYVCTRVPVFVCVYLLAPANVGSY